MAATEYNPKTFNAGQLVHKLLAALGVQLRRKGDDSEDALARAAVAKIKELKEDGKGGGNPLLPQGVDGGKLAPIIAMSTDDGSGDLSPAQADRIAASLVGMMGTAVDRGPSNDDLSEFERAVQRMGR